MLYFRSLRRRIERLETDSGVNRKTFVVLDMCGIPDTDENYELKMQHYLDTHGLKREQVGTVIVLSNPDGWDTVCPAGDPKVQDL